MIAGTGPVEQPVEAHNRHAGQGAVMLDIGGDVGAIVLRMPAELAGAEVEIRPVAGAATAGSPPMHLQHVAVLPRPVGRGLVHAAVFGHLRQGRYELYVRPDGPVGAAAEVRGGEVTFAEWC